MVTDIDRIPPSSLRYLGWPGWILTLHLYHVAGCPYPLLFLFERTYNYAVVCRQVQGSLGLTGEDPE